jgi:hypothetical protein
LNDQLDGRGVAGVPQRRGERAQIVHLVAADRDEDVTRGDTCTCRHASVGNARDPNAVVGECFVITGKLGTEVRATWKWGRQAVM